jgi:hypothetical protein
MKRSVVVAGLALVAGLGAVVVLGLVVVIGAWYYWPARLPASSRRPPLRAVMKDEEAPRPAEPSLALQVNEALEATVFAGTPLWFQLNVTNSSAMNDRAGTRVLREKIARLTAAGNAAAKAEVPRLEAALRRRTAPAVIKLGDAAHSWTAAVQFLAKGGKGGEVPLDLSLQPLGDGAGEVELGETRFVHADLGTASAGLAPGTYSIVACLGATGTWRGRACSEPVSLTVELAPNALSAEQEQSLLRQRARFGLRSGDFAAVERYGRALVSADPASVPGHVYLGDALLGQGKPEGALQEFLTARGEFERQEPDADEQPQYLTGRINQLLAVLH